MLASRGIHVAGLADVNHDAVRDLAADLGGVGVFADASSLIRSGGLDGIYLATPPNTHYRLVLEALAAGQHVLCEKPWVMNAGEARRLLGEIAPCRAAGLVAACCSSRFRFTPAATAAAESIASGRLGRLRHVRMSASVAPPQPLESLPPWKRDPATAGSGVSSDWCVYELDWLGAIIGPAFDPISVSAEFDDWRREGTGLDSGYVARIHCASGLSVEIRRLAEIGPREHKVEIRGSEGGIDLPFAPDATDRIAKFFSQASDGSMASEVLAEPVGDWAGILCGPLENFVAAIRSGRPVAATPESQVRVHSLLDAIVASARGGRAVTLE